MSQKSEDRLGEALTLCAIAEVELLSGQVGNAHKTWLNAGAVAASLTLESFPELAHRLATVGALLAPMAAPQRSL